MWAPPCFLIASWMMRGAVLLCQVFLPLWATLPQAQSWGPIDHGLELLKLWAKINLVSSQAC
jgi:hypothetical protein